MFYVLLDNLDEGLELNQFESMDFLLSFFRDKDYGKSNLGRALYIIVGQEIERAEFEKAVFDGEKRA